MGGVIWGRASSSSAARAPRAQNTNWPGGPSAVRSEHQTRAVGRREAADSAPLLRDEHHMAGARALDPGHAALLVFLAHAGRRAAGR